MDLLILDESMGGADPVGTARFDAPTITARQLIRARVELHVEQMRQPTNAGITSSTQRERDDLGGRGFGGFLFGDSDEPSRRRLDALIAVAEQGYAAGRYFLLLGDRQAGGLDEEIDLRATSEVTFLLITPLKGG